jgi:hypothetical protein
VEVSRARKTVQVEDENIGNSLKQEWICAKMKKCVVCKQIKILFEK